MIKLPMFNKEIKELCKTYKIIIIPLVFILLALMQPISMKLLPTLLKNASNLPAGTIIKIAAPSTNDVLKSILGQFGQMGTIVIILMLMGTIAGERSLEVTAMVLVKPIGRARYYFAKFFSYSILIICSMYIAIVFSAYYIEVLFGKVSWSHIMLGTTVYLPNLILIIAITMFFSSFLKSQIAVGGAACGVYIILSTVPQYLGGFLKSISINELVSTASDILTGANNIEFFKPVLGVMAMSVILVLAGWLIFDKQEI
jgi:ABC-2 type transport system permease protein